MFKYKNTQVWPSTTLGYIKACLKELSDLQKLNMVGGEEYNMYMKVLSEHMVTRYGSTVDIIKKSNELTLKYKI